MAHIRLLDMAVAYIIRGELEGGTEGAVRITKALLRGYGVDLEELHRQAMENLERDGYRFRRLEDILKEGLGCGAETEPDMPGPRMYVCLQRCNGEDDIFKDRGRLGKILFENPLEC